MKRSALPVVLAGTVWCVWAGLARPAPQPSEAPVDWEFQFTFKDLQGITVEVPGEREPRLFWYLSYQVTNHSDKDEFFVPRFDLYTHTGQLIHAGDGVPAYVFGHIKKLLNDPLLRDVSGMIGKLLQGEDNAKRGLALWPDFDPAAGVVKIFVTGLSGETVRIKLPKAVRVAEMGEKGELKEVEKDELVLAKTLQLTYSIPGQASARAHVAPKLTDRKWIMR